jgi:O-antigen/teichoic acid export membrane protein
LLGNIINTVFSRFAGILLTFLIVWMNTNEIGAQGQGDVALISLGILLIVGINNFMGGGAIVYLTSRIDPGKMLIPCAVWSIMVTLFFTLLFNLVHIVPDEYIIHVLVLGFMQSLFSFSQQICLGKNQVRLFNVLVLFQLTMIAGTLAVYYFILDQSNTMSYVAALYASFITTLLLGWIITKKFVGKLSNKKWRNTIREIWKYGFYSQTGNVFQLLAYRLGFIFLENLNSRGAVGIFSVGMQINEAVVTPAKSIATVQYAKLSNSNDKVFNINITLSLLKISLAITLLLGLATICLPSSFYLWLFGDDMEGLKTVLYWLFPGMGALAISSIIAHYFSGTGQPRHNSIGSLVTLSSLSVLGWMFIPDGGLIAAAWVSAVAYILQATYLSIVFFVDEKPDLKALRGSLFNLKMLK